MQSTNRLVIGTAQLGMPYGIANKTRKPDREMARAIVRTAWDHGISAFDTAQGYGDSEEVLGYALQSLGVSKQAKVITKFHPSLDHTDEGVLMRAIDESLEKIGVPILEGVFLHREDFLDLWEKGLGETMKKIKKSGKVRSIGISIYSPKKAQEALATDDIDSIQIPTNILDHRFEQADVFNVSEEIDKKMYIRSAFLQGLLLMDPDNLPKNVLFAAPTIRRVQEIAHKNSLTVQELALGYLKYSFPQSSVLIGAETPEQVAENCQIWEKDLVLDGVFREIQNTFASVDERILNPAKW